jgi:large subunit ribosomal protein L21
LGRLSEAATRNRVETMYAVIKTGGKQYKVAAGTLIAVEKLAGEAGDAVSFDQVLLVGGDREPSVGDPLVAGAAVAGEIVGQRRAGKILVFKKRRRQNSKRSRGHRQPETLVRITEILTDGKKPAAAKAKAKPAPEAAPSAADTLAEPELPPEPAQDNVDAAPDAAPAGKASTAEDLGEETKAKPARKSRAKAAESDD